MTDTLWGAIVGGILAITAAWMASRSASKQQARQWQLDLAVRLDTEMLAALQEFQRAIFDNATNLANAKRKSFPTEANRWNAAQFAMLLRGVPERTVLVRAIDLEVDRLAALSKAKVFDQAGFRQERIELGRLMARFIEESRTQFGLPSLKLATVWTWDT